MENTDLADARLKTHRSGKAPCSHRPHKREYPGLRQILKRDRQTHVDPPRPRPRAVTDDNENLHGIRAFLDTLSNVKKVEVLPYHTLGIYKWESLGIPYTLKNVDPPTAESVKRAEEILGCQK